MVLEIEVPPDEVDRHFATAYRHVAERTRVPGFRPGKAPRQVIDRFVGRGSVLAEAIDHLVQDSYDKALDQTDLIPIDQPAVDIDAASLAEGQAITFTATVPVRPEVSLGAYTDYSFGLEVPDVTDEQVEQVLTELREQQATLRPIDERGAQKDDIASVKFVGTIDGEPFDGGSADRLPLVIGEDRMIAGWEDQLIGLEIGGDEGLRQHVPRRLPRRGPARQGGALRGRAARPAGEGAPRADRRVRRRASPTSRPSRRCGPRSAMRSSNGPRRRPATPSATGSSTSRPPTPRWSSPR